MEEALLIPRPGAKFGRYPEKLDAREPWPFYPSELIRSLFLSVKAPSRRMQELFLKEVRSKCEQVSESNAQFISVSARRLRGKLAVDGFTIGQVAEAFALIDA